MDPNGPARVLQFREMVSALNGMARDATSMHLLRLISSSVRQRRERRKETIHPESFLRASVCSRSLTAPSNLLSAGRTRATQQGLRVVLDVVYNHTFAAGPTSPHSVLDKVVPG